MRQILLSLILLFSFGFSQSQSVFNPNDPVINYVATDPQGPTNPPVQFTYTITKWVRTPKMSWDASRYKCYLIGNVPFRLRFPDSYQPGVNDGKKYPIMLFFHGGGEANSDIHDNEFQLYNGGQTFGQKIANGGQDAFVLFPQSKTVGWGDTYFVPMNIVLDSLIKNCKGDPDRVLAMGLSIGGSAAIDYATEYPQRAAAIITSSPVYMRGYASTMSPCVHLPIWLGNGGTDTNPLPDDVNYFEGQYNTTLGGNLSRSFYPPINHVMWDYQWAEEPKYYNAISTAHKANPLVFFNKRLYCPGATISSRLGITQGFAQYQWDKNGVVISGATNNEYIATDFGTYRARFKRTASSDWSDWSPVPAIISPVCPGVAGTGTGLKGTYFSNKNLTAPSSATRTDATINFGYDGTTSPIPPVPGTGFSVRWTGKIQPQYTDTYTFFTNSDDGIRLWINGVVVIDNFTDHGSVENNGAISLLANQKYDIKIEYFNSGGPGNAILSWAGFLQTKQVVPKTQLYPDGTGDPDVPLCTTNTSPANGSTIAAGTSVPLSWNSVFNAASYDVYVWNGATPPSSPTANVTTNTYTAAGLIASSTYNWYVVPKNITGSATGCGTNNKTTFITPAGVPFCTTNSLPVNASTVVTPTSATLTWGAIGNATAYDIYIWSGSTPPAAATATVTAPTVTYNATSLTPSTLYNWYVVPKNAAGPAVNCNINSSIFTTAVLAPLPLCTSNSTPVNGAVLGTQTTANLAWTAAANATSYDVYVYTGTTIPGSPTATISAPAVTYIATSLSANTSYNWFVVPKNATGSATGCSGNATSFVTSPLAPLCTPNLTPSNNATLVPTTATLTWTAAAGATSYDVYLYTGTTVPGSPTATVGAVTSYTTTTILANSTTYNWFVVPKNAGGSPTTCQGNATSFTTIPVPAPACTPNLTPAANATLIPITATLTWTAAPGATAYDVYVYTGTVVPGSPTATVTGATTLTTAALGYSTSYNWFVVPKNTTGSATGCAANASSFTTIPVPAPSCTPNLTPAANATLVPVTATLTWTAAANASGYDVYVYTGTVVPGTPTATVTGVTTYTTAALAYSTSYNWFVVPKNTTGSATGCVANATSFTTAAIPAPVCTPNLLPANNATAIPITATLTWTAAAGATGYDVYVYTGTVVPGTPTATVSNVTTYTTAALAYSTSYNWFVVPKNASGGATGCSANATSFTTAAVPVPPCTTNLTPGVNATLVPTTATLTWTAAANAASYDVYIYTGTVVPTLPTATVSGVTTYTTTTALAYSTAYNWFMVPRNTSGAATGCSGNATSFTTAPIPAPSCTPNATPANNATLVPTTAVLTWTAAANATAYDVYVYTGTVVPGSPTATVTGVTTYTTGILANSTTYNWFVVPKNTTGSATGCSGNATAFTTAAIPVPSCTTILTPANNATLVPITATLTWTAAAGGATGYDIYVYTGAVVPGSPTATVTSVTTYTTAALAYSTSYNWFVVPKNTSGSATGCAGNTTSFTTIPVPAPSCTPGIAPANNATLVATTTTLTWTAAVNATSYDVFLWTGGITPSTPIATVSSASYDASGLNAGASYNWYVVPKNATGSATGCSTSNKFVFTTAPTLPPLCTSNILPASSALLTTPTTAALSWTAVANADAYDVYLWTGGIAPSTPVATVNTPSYAAIGLAPNSIYNWYIVPKNAGGFATGCSGNATTFTTAVDVPACTATVSPVSGTAIGTPTTASLTWTASPGATSYDIYVYTGAAIPSSPTATVSAPTVTYNATGLSALTAYNWFVVPKNTTGAAANCSVSFKSTFTTSAIAAPACATNISPANTTTIGSQTTITLSWSNSPTATSYDVYLWSGGVTPSSPIATVASPGYTTNSLIAGTTYSWYIIPKNSSGGAFNCASANTWTFTTQAAAITPPSCTTGFLPASGSLLVTQTTAALSWSTVSAATAYDVYLWTGATAPGSPTITVATNAYNPTNLTPATTYNWYVVPRNTGGPATGCSGNVLTFITAAIPVPICAVNNLPVSGSTILTQNTATLTWGNIVNATSYDVYIWTGATVPTTATATVTTNSYPATGLIANTTYNWYVVPKNASGPATGCDQSNKSTFITAPIPAPSCTTNSSPTGGITIATATSALLVWTAAANATAYDVYIWTGSTPPTTAVATVTSGTAYTATGLTASSTYNWYVVPKNATGSATGCAANASIFVTAAIPAPSCTPNLLPAPNATGVSTTATLTWTAAANATSYDVYVYTGAVVPGSPTATVNGLTTYTTAVLGYSTTYNWFVVPKNSTGSPTGCSATATSFTTVAAPLPSCTANVLPAANATGVSITATLTWTAAANATAYDIYVYTGAVVPGLPTATVTGVTTYTTAALANATAYNWFVVPKNGSGTATGCATNVTAFTTISAPVPTCTSNLAPAANATGVPTTATLTWTASPTATSYDVYIYTGTTVPTLPTATVGSTTTYTTTVALANATTYNWFVVPRNASGPATGCSGNAIAFTTIPVPAPSCTANLSPVANSTLVPVTATLTWTAAANATGYDIYVYTGTVVPGTPTATVTGVTTYTTAALAYSTSYNWFVVPKNTSGSATGCQGNATAFTTAAIPVPLCTTGLTPAANATGVSITATLTWTAAAGATAYDVYVYTGTVVPGTPTATVTGATTYTTAALAYSTSYNWFVVPKNASGTASSCSVNAAAFTTIPAPAPSCTSNLAPLANATAVPTTTILTWTAAGNATAYDVYVYTGTVVPGSPTATVTGVTTYTTALLANATTYNWFVVPKNASGSATGCSGNATAFTTAAIPAPSCITGLTPANNATAVPVVATLTWTAAANATAYDVYVYTGTVVPGTPTATVTGLTTYTTAALGYSTNYNWFVVPKNASGSATGCSGNATAFTTAAIPVPSCTTGLTPANNITIGAPTTATLTWSAAINATAYDVYVYTGTVVPGSPTATVTGVTTYTATGLVSSTAYNWFVVPNNTSGSATGCASNKLIFTTANNVAGTGLQGTYYNGMTLTGTPLLTRVDPTVNFDIGAGSPAPGTVPVDFYSVRWTGQVKAVFSETYTFYTNADDGIRLWVNGVQLVDNWVDQGATEKSGTVSMVAGQKYDIIVEYYEKGGGALTQLSWSGASTPKAIVPQSQLYPTGIVTPVIISCAINATPATGSTLTTSTGATLTWSEIAGATSYDVYVYTGATAPASPTGNTTTPIYIVTGLTAATSYNWFVIPKNAAGSAAGCGTLSKSTFITANAIASDGTGLQGVYYNGMTLTGTPLLTRVDPVIDFDLGTGSPAPGIVPVDFYSVRWTGQVKAVFSETYTFYTKADDGIRLWVNGVQLVDNFVDQGPTEKSGTIALVAGQKYDIVVEYYERDGGALTQLRWSSASTPKAIIPQINLYPPGTVAVPSCTTGLLPANNATAVPVVATLTWTAAANATAYDVYVYTGAVVPGTPTATVTGATTYTTAALGYSTNYNWFVVPKNAGGPATGCSGNTKAFTTIQVPVPSCTINLTPLNSAIVSGSATATLTWTAAANATAYDVYVYTGTVVPGSPTATVTGDTTYTATGLTASTAYNWFVVPKNISGSATGCVSNKFGFTTAASGAIAGTGLQGSYYNGLTLTGTPLLTRVDPTVNFDIGAGSPAPGTVPVDFYSVRWTGQVKAVFSETYTFYTNADDGIRLWVNGVQLVDNWVDQGATEKSGTVSMVAGQKYDIIVEYYEKGGGALTQLSWSGASTPKAIVPQSQLYPTGIVTPVIISCAINATPATGSTLTTSTGATLTWSEIAGATSYDVYVYTGATAPASPTGNTTTPIYIVTGLTAATSYNWFVIPKNAAGSAAGCGTLSKSTFITANAIASDGTGLQGVYYNGMTLTGTPLLTRVDPVIDFDLGTGSPAPGIVPVDFYSVRWTGQVKAVFSETYTFYTKADDGIRLWVNGVQLVDNFVDQGPTEKSGTIALVAGQKYDIVVEYYERDGGALTQLRWSSTSTPKAIIPQINLYPPAAQGALVANAVSAQTVSTDSRIASSVPVLTSSVSPNPIKPGQAARLQINSDKTGTALISIVNGVGFVISTQKINLVPGVNTSSINTSMLGQGFYVINITGGDKPVNVKLLVE